MESFAFPIHIPLLWKTFPFNNNHQRKKSTDIRKRSSSIHIHKNVPTIRQIIRKDRQAVRQAITNKQITKPNRTNLKQITPWKDIPEKGALFCAYWAKHKISNHVRETCFDTLEKYAKRIGIGENLEHMDSKRLLALFTAVDIIWFGGVMTRYITRRNVKQECGTSPHPTSKRVAGYCKWSWSKQMGIRLKINMCKPVLCEKELFPTANQLEQGTHSPKRYQVGGVICSSPLECMLQTFVHEITHAIVQMFCPERTSHGPVFRMLVKAIFGQKTSTHGLGTRLGKTSGFRGSHSSDYVKFVKKNIKKGQSVTFYVGKVKKKGMFQGKSKGNRAIIVSGNKIYSGVPWEFLTIVK